jgi:hypothetical protein
MREQIISLIAKDSTITMHGVLVDDNGLQWIIDEVYEDTLKVKYPRRERLLRMSKNGWREYALLDREIEP